MYTLFLIGNIASGKSTAVRYLEARGARRLDLDAMAKQLYVPGSDLVSALAEEFGADILDEYGSVRFPVLAARAFESRERAQALESIVYPALLEQLTHILCPVPCWSASEAECGLSVVEISNAAAFTDAFGLADGVMAITASLETRRARAIARGMASEDFDARAAVQPSEQELCALASWVIDNEQGDDALFASLDTWLEEQRIAFPPQEDIHE